MRFKDNVASCEELLARGDINLIDAGAISVSNKYALVSSGGQFTT